MTGGPKGNLPTAEPPRRIRVAVLEVFLAQAVFISGQREVADMKPANDAIKHCRCHIERTRAALQREALGRNTYDLRRHLKTLEALLAVHKAAPARRSLPAGS